MDNRLAEARNFLDLNGLNAIRVQAKSGDEEGKKAALQEAAQQFEAIFMKMLLKSMRKAEDVLASDSPFNSESTKFYRDMHDQQMAVDLSSSGSLGLSDLIVRQLGGASDDFTPRTLLRNDGNLDSARKNAVYQPVSTNDQTISLTNSDNKQQASNNSQSPSAFSVFQTNSLSAPDFNQPKDFVLALIEPAKKVEKQLGIPFSVVIAQAALETGWGQKIIQHPDGRSSNNLFNIKADARWQGEKVQKETLEFENNTMVKKSAPFRLYESIKDSVDDYINFLSTNDRYQNAIQNSSNVEHFLQGIQKAGYATDPDYANKIMGTLRKVTSLINQ